MPPNNQDDTPAENADNEVVFVPDAPSRPPVYFGGNLRADVVQTAELNTYATTAALHY